MSVPGSLEGKLQRVDGLLEERDAQIQVLQSKIAEKDGLLQKLKDTLHSLTTPAANNSRSTIGDSGSGSAHTAPGPSIHSNNNPCGEDSKFLHKDHSVFPKRRGPQWPVKGNGHDSAPPAIPAIRSDWAGADASRKAESLYLPDTEKVSAEVDDIDTVVQFVESQNLSRSQVRAVLSSKPRRDEGGGAPPPKPLPCFTDLSVNAQANKTAPPAITGTPSDVWAPANQLSWSVGGLGGGWRIPTDVSYSHGPQGSDPPALPTFDALFDEVDLGKRLSASPTNDDDSDADPRFADRDPTAYYALIATVGAEPTMMIDGIAGEFRFSYRHVKRKRDASSTHLKVGDLVQCRLTLDMPRRPVAIKRKKTLPPQYVPKNLDLMSEYIRKES
eukprot:TRINITY_DN32346_c0_g1_i1.p1 TRINITY_DN32346_c0_g1~~TRINITY_DN32346_c0_g1_i1.p1  ORF type:complete len:403 (+),score=75.55 TRINITY_DN32346_c0_g1_i1:53-1210(+)